jgi:uncharacterized protein (DUF111 family)
MKTAYLDCFSGLSGDMFLGSLLDVGLSFDRLKECLRSLPFHGYELEARREMRQHISGTRFLVHLKKSIIIQKAAMKTEGLKPYVIS